MYKHERAVKYNKGQLTARSEVKRREKNYNTPGRICLMQMRFMVSMNLYLKKKMVIIFKEVKNNKQKQ